MINKLETSVLKRIQEMDWEFCVKRTGYLQSKVIVIKAEMTPLLLTPSVSLSYDSMLWVSDENLYDDTTTRSFSDKIRKAFTEEKNWPIKIVERFHTFTNEKDDFLNLTNNIDNLSLDEKKTVFKSYSELLKKIQNYYLVARTLTNYCEAELKKSNPEYLIFAYPYEKLDVDHMNFSLKDLKRKEVSGTLERKDIETHLNKFQWIKTAYNIIGKYTESDFMEEIKTVSVEDKEIHDIPDDYLLNGLRIGIFTRNRIKELSQQIWFAFESVAISLAKEMNIQREDFYSLLYEEVFDILDGKCKFDASIIKERSKGYVYGFIDNKELLIIGADYLLIQEALSRKHELDVKEVKGQIACKGNVTGRVKVIKSQEDFGKLIEGDILVTTMTTPDYMIVIKKAGAIVTDEGGLSCHAAIVSREFKIPCIMGTKIATKVLKDGDLVEVDADKGIVRIIR